jgi:hypothetical protein
MEKAINVPLETRLFIYVAKVLRARAHNTPVNAKREKEWAKALKVPYAITNKVIAEQTNAA